MWFDTECVAKALIRDPKSTVLDVLECGDVTDYIETTDGSVEVPVWIDRNLPKLCHILQHHNPHKNNFAADGGKVVDGDEEAADTDDDGRSTRGNSTEIVLAAAEVLIHYVTVHPNMEDGTIQRVIPVLMGIYARRQKPTNLVFFQTHRILQASLAMSYEETIRSINVAMGNEIIHGFIRNLEDSSVVGDTLLGIFKENLNLTTNDMGGSLGSGADLMATEDGNSTAPAWKETTEEWLRYRFPMFLAGFVGVAMTDRSREPYFTFLRDFVKKGFSSVVGPLVDQLLEVDVVDPFFDDIIHAAKEVIKKEFPMASTTAPGEEEDHDDDMVMPNLVPEAVDILTSVISLVRKSLPPVDSVEGYLAKSHSAPVLAALRCVGDLAPALTTAETSAPSNGGVVQHPKLLLGRLRLNIMELFCELLLIGTLEVETAIFQQDIDLRLLELCECHPDHGMLFSAARKMLSQLLSFSPGIHHNDRFMHRRAQIVQRICDWVCPPDGGGDSNAAQLPSPPKFQHTVLRASALYILSALPGGVLFDVFGGKKGENVVAVDPPVDYHAIPGRVAIFLQPLEEDISPPDMSPYLFNEKAEDEEPIVHREKINPMMLNSEAHSTIVLGERSEYPTFDNNNSTTTNNGRQPSDSTSSSSGTGGEGGNLQEETSWIRKERYASFDIGDDGQTEAVAVNNNSGSSSGGGPMTTSSAVVGGGGDDAEVEGMFDARDMFLDDVEPNTSEGNGGTVASATDVAGQQIVQSFEKLSFTSLEGDVGADQEDAVMVGGGGEEEEEAEAAGGERFHLGRSSGGNNSNSSGGDNRYGMVEDEDEDYDAKSRPQSASSATSWNAADTVHTASTTSNQQLLPRTPDEEAMEVLKEEEDGVVDDEDEEDVWVERTIQDVSEALA